ncbi:MAG: hypothetical protein Q8P67_02575 [archaeon]|nr:hypothetical protein [archaeon]
MHAHGATPPNSDQPATSRVHRLFGVPIFSLLRVPFRILFHHFFQLSHGVWVWVQPDATCGTS